MQVVLLSVNSDLKGRLLGQFSSSATLATSFYIPSPTFPIYQTGIKKIMLASVLTTHCGMLRSMPPSQQPARRGHKLLQCRKVEFREVESSLIDFSESLVSHRARVLCHIVKTFYSPLWLVSSLGLENQRAS